jgi:hypothetical protein
MAGEVMKNAWGDPPGGPPTKSAWGPAPQKTQENTTSQPAPKNGLGDPLREMPKSVWGEPPQRDPKDQANKELKPTLNTTTNSSSSSTTMTSHTHSSTHNTHSTMHNNTHSSMVGGATATTTTATAAGDPMRITNPWKLPPPPAKKDEKTMGLISDSNNSLSMSKDKASMHGGAVGENDTPREGIKRPSDHLDSRTNNANASNTNIKQMNQSGRYNKEGGGRRGGRGKYFFIHTIVFRMVMTISQNALL